jgi:DNA-binding CsgD family transcriptional regulator
VRLLVTPAVEALGLQVVAAGDGASETGLAAVFLPLVGQPDCRSSCCAARASAGHRAAPLVVGYGMGSPALLAGHRAHGCADLVLLLVASAGGPRFAHLPASDPVTQAGLTRREADVLVLLLDGLTTRAVAGRLCVSASTARSHCRAVLRKFGAGDRRALRALLPVSSAGADRSSLVGPLVALPEGLAAPLGHLASQVCPGGGAKFADECAVAPPRRSSHT